MRLLTTIFAASTVFAATPVTAAAFTVDQQNTVGTITNSLLFFGSGQSFTPTFSSINSASFLFAANNALLQATLYAGSGILGTSLATSNIVNLTGGTFQEVLFNFAPTSLTAGSVYTLFVRSSTGGFGQTFSTDNPYAGGVAFNETGGAASSVDLRFAEGVAGVPEPATWAMMIAGFGLVGGAMRRRSTKVAFA